MQASHKAWQAKDVPAFTCFCSNSVLCHLCPLVLVYYLVFPNTSNSLLVLLNVVGWWKTIEQENNSQIFVCLDFVSGK